MKKIFVPFFVKGFTVYKIVIIFLSTFVLMPRLYAAESPFALCLQACRKRDPNEFFKQLEYDASMPLHSAAFKGDIPAIKALLERGAGMEAANKFGVMPLHFAAQGGRLPVVEFFVKNGARIDVQTQCGWTALHFAAYFGHLPIVEFLLARGAMEKACFIASEFIAPEEVTSFVAALRGLEDVTPSGEYQSTGVTPMHLAAQNGHLSVVQALIARNHNVNAQDIHKWAPLHCAVKNSNFLVVKNLIDGGAFVDIPNAGGRTPLHLVAQNNCDLLVLRALVCNGANVDALDDSGMTPLHLAVRENNVAAVEALVAYGAKINMRSSSGYTAFYFAAQKHCDDSNYAKKQTCLDIVRCLVNNDWTILDEQYGDTQSTALHVALGNYSFPIAQLLLALGAKIDLARKDGETPLHMATRMRQDDIVTLIKGWPLFINGLRLCCLAFATAMHSRCCQKSAARVLTQDARVSPQEMTNKICSYIHPINHSYTPKEIRDYIGWGKRQQTSCTIS